jgi:hypothetical protein
MRKFLIFVVIGLTFLLVGFTGKLPAPVEGIYSLKLKTLTVFDLSSGEIPLYGNMAELTDSKPDSLEVEGIDYKQLPDVKFGSFRFGNNEKKVWFLVTKSALGYWDNFYVDQNLDNKITKKEAIRSFQTSQQKKSGYNILRADALIPIPIRISYKGITREYEKSLYFFISTLAESKKNEYHVAVVAFSASFLEGEMKAALKKEEKLYKFMILDGDANGCFNDYGKDLFFINLQRDSSFHKKESQKLADFFDSTGVDNKNKQLRFNLLPYCLQLGVTKATGDFDLSQLEPPLNEENDIKPENTPKPEPSGAPESQSVESVSQGK